MGGGAGDIVGCGAVGQRGHVGGGHRARWGGNRRDNGGQKRVSIGYAKSVGAFYQPSAFELMTAVEEGVRLAPSQEVTVAVRYFPSDSFSSAALLIETDSDAVTDGLYVVELWGRIFNW